MAKATLLEQLRDIHLPPAIHESLAPGWYGLGVLSLGLLLGISYFSYRRHCNSRAKQQALKLIATYQQQYLVDKNSQIACAQVSALLRRVALAYFPRAKVAALTADDWIDFLNITASTCEFTPLRQLLLVQPYCDKPANIDLAPLFLNARRWIKRRKTPCFP